MTKLDFYAKTKIPNGGLVFLVRDNELYRTWGARQNFCIVDDDTIPNKRIYTTEIKNSDRIYYFPENKDIFLTLTNNRCLDKFLIKQVMKSRDEIRKEIIKKLDNGKIIGVHSGSTKYHVRKRVLSIDTDTYVDLFKSDGSFFCSIDDFESARNWYEFSNIYELGHWLLS